MVKTKRPPIKRSQLWITDLNPGFGEELHKKRPSVVVSSDVINKHSPTVIVLPVTSQVFPERPDKIYLSQKESGLNKDSAILTDQIRAVDKSRLLKKIGSLSEEKLSEIEDALMLVLALKQEG